MNTVPLLMICTTLWLAACQSTPSRSAADAPLAAGSAHQHHATLLHTRWHLTQADDTTWTHFAPERQPFIQLSEDQHSNRLIGMGGCNRLMGSYLLDGKYLTFAVASTKMFCQDQHQIERQFLAGLSQTTTYQIHGHTLHLIDSAGNVRLRLTAAE